MAKQALEGVKVVEFTWVIVGPAIGRELASHGATVVRVECHRRPDMLRTAMPFKDGITDINHGAFGMFYHTNKKSISLDLNMPKGQEVARRLVAWADVVIESMTPGSMAALGLDYKGCKKIKPDIIYCSTTQMGQTGPLARFGGFGAAGAAYAGFSHLTGWPDRDPLPLLNNQPDHIAPYLTAGTIIGALLYRRKTGKGMYLDNSQLESAVGFLAPVILDYMVNGHIACRKGNRDPYMAPHGVYPCRGADRWVAIAISNEEEWEGLCCVMGNPEWTREPKFSTVLGRKENEEELDRLIGDWTKDYTAEQIMAMTQDAGVPCGVVQNAEDLFSDPQLKHRQHLRFLEQKVIGRMAFEAPAYHLSKTPNHIWKAAPCLGEDNEYVYKEILGYSEDEIADLLAEGVITTETDVPSVLTF